MRISTSAIVLSKLKYGDHSLIVKCYTRRYGITSFLLKNILKSKKGKVNSAYFQMFSILEIEMDHNSKRSLQYIREVSLLHPLKTVHTNMLKSAIVMFLSEVIASVLKEEEQNKDLYDFLETSIIWFDTQDVYGSFHLMFLIEFTKYLGFYPNLSQSGEPYFNLLEGKSQKTKTNNYCVSGHKLTLLKDLLGIKFDDDKKHRFNANQKQELLDMILLYFKLHLDGFKEPRSRAVLNQVFK